jgi:hypothetical protein
MRNFFMKLLPKEVFEEDVERLHRPKPILKPKPDETLT